MLIKFVLIYETRTLSKLMCEFGNRWHHNMYQLNFNERLPLKTAIGLVSMNIS